MSSILPTDAPPEPVAANPRRRLLIFARCAFIFAALVTLLLAGKLIENLRGNAEWKAYQNEARARGVKLTLAEFIPPAVPEERNFAAIPLLQDAFKSPNPPNPLVWPSGPGAKVPPLGAVYKDEFVDLGAWQKFFVDAELLAAPGANPAADVLKALDHYAPQMEQLRLAGQRPDARYPVNYEAGFAATLPHLQVLQSAARIYTLRLAAHLALGESPTAYEDFRGAFRLYGSLDNEPTLITGLVRLSILAMEENAVAAGLHRHLWGAAELEKIITDLDRLHPLQDYVFALGSERAFGNATHEEFLHSTGRKFAAMLATASGVGQSSRWWSVFHFSPGYPSGWLRMSETRSNRYIDEMLARVGQEPPRIFPERPVPHRPDAYVAPLDRLRYILFLVVAPALSQVERTYAYGQTLLDETRIGCALERHRLAHGSYPASLNALVPIYLPAVPLDVMNGEPLHYHRDADGGGKVYSVAWNLKDEGGTFDAKAPVKDQPDWVWIIRPSKPD